MSRGTPEAVVARGNDLLGTAEVEELLGVPRSTITRWLRDGKMPRPEAKLRATPVWKRTHIERFKAEREAKIAA